MAAGGRLPRPAHGRCPRHRRRDHCRPPRRHRRRSAGDAGVRGRARSGERIAHRRRHLPRDRRPLPARRDDRAAEPRGCVADGAASRRRAAPGRPRRADHRRGARSGVARCPSGAAGGAADDRRSARRAVRRGRGRDAQVPPGPGVRRMSVKPTSLPRASAWAMKRLLYHSGLLALARMTRQHGRAMVLRYHAVTEGTREVPYAGPDICLPVEAFRLQAAYMKRAYSVVPIDELVEAVVHNRPLPRRALAITFDDGYADNFTRAFPILHRLGLPACVYVSTGSLDDAAPLWMSAVRALVHGARGAALEVPGIGRFDLDAGGRNAAARVLTRELVPAAAAVRTERLAALAAANGVDIRAALRGSMLSWDQVRVLASSGWTVGAHTVNHVNVALADPGEAEQEIVASRDAIEQRLRMPVHHFAYTNSGAAHEYHSTAAAELLRRCGFRSAATSEGGILRHGTDVFRLPRVGVGPRLTPVADFAAALERRRHAA